MKADGSRLFLRRVWGAQGHDGYVFLSAKAGGLWREDDPVAVVGGTPSEVKLPNDGNDVYFAPTIFRQGHRQRQHALGGVWLYADLDEVDPHTLTDLPPQIAWETSPGRYQAMWRLDQRLGPKALERLNKGVTYYTGADKGGWSLTKVLRVPGTTSTKYDEPWSVRLLWARWQERTDVDVVRGLAKGAVPSSDPASGRIILPKATGREIRRTHWETLPPKARQLLKVKTPDPGDDRSVKLWELEKLLLKAGLTRGEVVKVAMDSAWNKYSGQRREKRQLWTEVTKAAAAEGLELGDGKKERGVGGKEKEKDGGLPAMKFDAFMAMSLPVPSWLVQGIWGKGLCGPWAGEFKSYKTTSLLDFVLSVASGMDFLGQFPVKDPGCALYLHEEGRMNEIQELFRGIAARKGLAPKVSVNEGKRSIKFADKGVEDLPLWITSFAGLNLSEEGSRERLLNHVAHYKPKVVVLESWYLIAGDVDENVAVEVKPVLDWLLTMGREQETAVIVSHHFNKQAKEYKRPAARLSGSNVWSRFFESAVFLERSGDEGDYAAKFEAQHRAFTGLTKMLAFDMATDENEDRYEVTVTDPLHDVSEDMPDVKEGTGDWGLDCVRDLEKGEWIELEEAAKEGGCTQGAMKKRVLKSASFGMRQKGASVVIVRTRAL